MTKDKGIHDVLSLEEIISDLLEWNSKSYQSLIEERNRWCGYLFDSLTGNNN